MARKVTTILALRDNYTAVIKKAKRYTSAFDKDVQKMTARLDKSAAKKRELRIKDAPARKALNALEKKIEPMRNVMVKVAANVAHFRHSFKPVEQAADKVLSKAWVVTVKLKDAASAGLRKLTSALKKAASVVLVGGAAAAAAGGYALNSGMTLEGYEVCPMLHTSACPRLVADLDLYQILSSPGALRHHKNPLDAQERL